jgi:hypothetical protein
MARRKQAPGNLLFKVNFLIYPPQENSLFCYLPNFVENPIDTKLDKSRAQSNGMLSCQTFSWGSVSV